MKKLDLWKPISGSLTEKRLRELEDANKELSVFQNTDCVLWGDLKDMIAACRELTKLKKVDRDALGQGEKSPSLVEALESVREDVVALQEALRSDDEQMARCANLTLETIDAALNAHRGEKT